MNTTSIFERLQYQERPQDLADLKPDNYTITEPVESIICTHPVWYKNHEANDYKLFYGEYKPNNFPLEFQFEGSYFAHLTSAQVHGREYLIVSERMQNSGDKSSRKVEVRQGYLPRKILGKKDEMLSQSGYRNFQQIRDASFLVPNYLHGNYFHWLLGCLPKFEHLIDNPLFENTYLVVPKKLLDFQRESLEIMKIDKSRLIPYDNTHWLFDKLYLSSFRELSPRKIRWLEKLAGKTTKHQGANIYISRSDTNSRHISNENELLEVLQRYNFNKAILSQMSLYDQIELFSNAAIIIAAHGAGLSNLVFSPPGTHVIELMPFNSMIKCYWVLSNIKNINYSLIGCNYDRDNQKIVVPIKKIRNIISELNKQ